MTKRNSHITTVYPIAGGNGASYTTMQIARALREVEKYKKIAVVDFDFSAPVLGEGIHEDTTHGIDMLVDKINGNILSNEMFLENMIRLKDDIHLLRGTQIGHRFPFVGPKHLEVIIEKLRDEYDYIFIASSDDILDGGTAAALFHADRVLVVGRYTQKNQWRLKDAITNINSYTTTKQIAFIYNLYEDQNQLDFSREIPDNWQFCGTVGYDASTIDNHTSALGALPFGKGKVAENAKITYREALNALHLLNGEVKISG